MKYLMIPLLALTFFAGSPDLDARCSRPEQGPPGPLLTDYIGVNSNLLNDGQALDPFEPTLVEFPLILAGPVGITPGGTNNTEFTVDKDGVYLICWSVNASTNARVFTDDIVPAGTPPFLELDLLVNLSSVSLSPVQSLQSLLPSGEALTINIANLSGQIKLELTAGDTIQLGAVAVYQDGEDVEFTLFSNLFNIVRIADLP